MSFSDSIFIFGLALVIFGPKKLPEIGRQIGKLVYEFRRASNEFKLQIEEELRSAEQADRQKQYASETTSLPAASVVSSEMSSDSSEGLTARPPSTGTLVSTENPSSAFSDGPAQEVDTDAAAGKFEDDVGKAEDSYSDPYGYQDEYQSDYETSSPSESSPQPNDGFVDPVDQVDQEDESGIPSADRIADYTADRSEDRAWDKYTAYAEPEPEARLEPAPESAASAIPELPLGQDPGRPDLEAQERTPEPIQEHIQEQAQAANHHG